MHFSEANRLLDPTPMPVETGYERLPNGVLHVACRTDLRGCDGEMFEWWFRSRPNTQQYVWWHPVDHVSSDWIGGDSSTHVGSIHKVEEFFTGLPAAKLLIQFRPNEEFFDADAYRTARSEGYVSASVCGRTGMSWEAPVLPDGRLLGGRLLHIGRDTPWGCALRSHFYMGEDLPAIGKTPNEIAELVPDTMAVGLLQHCYNEFTFLSRFLPSLFIAENRSTRAVKVPW